MPLVNYSFTALIDTDSGGDNIVASQAVAVRSEFDATYATIYSDSAGVSPISQPGAATDSNGVLEFYVLPGYYTITSGTRTESVLIDDGSRLNPSTTADMAASKHIKVGEKGIKTKEFSTGNGGGGTYDCVTVGTTANVDLPNGYNIIVSTVDATKCFVLRIGSEINMRQLGSTGLAGSDNTAIFNQAKTLGVPVIFDTGTYEINNASTSDNLKVTGKGYPVIKLFGAATIALSSSGDNVEISGLEFDLDDVVNSLAISDSGGENVVIKGNNFKGHVQAISYNSTGKRIKIIDNDFFGGAYGVLVNSSAAGERMIIANNTFDGNNLTANRDAIEINLPTGSFPYINITDNVIRNYDAGSASSGFGVGIAGGKHIVVSGNVIDNCGYQGIHLEDESEYCVVSGNTISNTGGGTNAPVDTTQHSGIWISESYFCNVADNVVFNSVGSGIKFTGATVSRHCKISDNMCYDNDDNGIEVSTGRFIDIIANHCKSNQNSGIEISGPARCTISANFCYNDSTPSAAYTQATGINITGTPTNTVLMNNTCYDNTTDFSGVASSSTVFAAFNNLLDSAAESATRTYTPTNVTTDRAFDADTVALTELADVVGTLIADMQEKGLIS